MTITSAFFALFFVYVGGVTPSLAYLTVSGHKDYIPLAAAVSGALYAAFLVYRVRATLRAEWSQSLERTPGVFVSPAEQTIRREPGTHHDQRRLSRIAVVMLAVFVPVLYFAHGTPAYLFILFVVMSPCIGLLLCCVVSWWIAYAIAVRRWEQTHGVLLQFHALGRRLT